eukprot:gene31048-7141_t
MELMHSSTVQAPKIELSPGGRHSSQVRQLFLPHRRQDLRYDWMHQRDTAVVAIFQFEGRQVMRAASPAAPWNPSNFPSSFPSASDRNKAQQQTLGMMYMIAAACSVSLLLIAASLFLLYGMPSPAQCLGNHTYSGNVVGRSHPHSHAGPWCSYGSLPATWVNTAHVRPRWFIFDPVCRLQDLLTPLAPKPLVSKPPDKHPPFKVSIIQDPIPASTLDHLPLGSKNESGFLFVSDSIDRYLMTYLCLHMGGTMSGIVLSSVLGQAYSLADNSLESIETANLTEDDIAGYSVNTCTSNSSVRLASTYIPGVHPDGPYHKHRTLSFKERIDHAAAKTPLFIYHPIMLPKYDPLTGFMEKTYLGRRVFVEQLNAAGAHVAHQMGVEVLDYEQMGRRFMEGQAYLTDLIHPRREVGLELANIYLNYAELLKQDR